MQIVHSSGPTRDIEHLGSTHDEEELETLKAAAKQRLAGGQASSTWAWTAGRSPRMDRGAED